MADTLEASLRSLLGSRDGRFEVLLVDDGSNDRSVEIVKVLQTEFPALRLLELKRDSKRRLGETRNISIREARGEYVLLHLDCDDVWEPHLGDFVEVFHQIERAARRDLFVCGQHVNMGRKDFLLAHGPYDNIFRGEDRFLWAKMAAIDSFIPLEHTAFFKRLSKPVQKNAWRSLYHTWDHFVNDFRAGLAFQVFLKYEFKQKNTSWKNRIWRLLVCFPAYIYARFLPPIDVPKSMRDPDNFRAYREKRGGNLKKILDFYGAAPDYSVLSAQGQKIFGAGE